MEEGLKKRRDELYHEQNNLRRKIDRIGRELTMVERGVMPPDREDEWYVPPFLRFNEDLVREDDAWDKAWDGQVHTPAEYQQEIHSLRTRVRHYLGDIWRLNQELEKYRASVGGGN
jgi:hypothetical protein